VGQWLSYVNGGCSPAVPLPAPHGTPPACRRLNWKQINGHLRQYIKPWPTTKKRTGYAHQRAQYPEGVEPLVPGRSARTGRAGDNGLLLNLRKRMARIRVFDPACGSATSWSSPTNRCADRGGNQRRRGETSARQRDTVTNFRGVELRDFPAEIARLALIIAEFQCDVLYRGQKDALASSCHWMRRTGSSVTMHCGWIG
jgi:hypothetical protein